MKVILKADIKGVGRKYEIKEVSDGYANNFLIPKKLVEYASPEAVKKADILRATSEAEVEIREKLTQKQIEMKQEIVASPMAKAAEQNSQDKANETSANVNSINSLPVSLPTALKRISLMTR